MAVETVTIVRVSVTDKKADGTILKNQFGEFFRVGIQTEEHLNDGGDSVWINGFLKERPQWNVGDKLEVELKETEYKGEKQLQFRLVKDSSGLETRVKKLEDKVFGDVKVEADDTEQPF